MQQTEQRIASQSADSISVRIGELVDQASDRSEFLKSLASELVVHFQTGIVAIHTSEWTNPMMLVLDDVLSQQIERAAIIDLLETATRSPIACSIGRIGDQSPTRGLRVELTESPNRAALMLVYPHDQMPTGTDQIRDLQRLGTYADCTRKLIDTLPIVNVPVGESEAVQTNAGDSETSSDTSRERSLISPANADQLTSADQRSLRSFHSDLNLDATGYRIANESRRMLQCDRVTVLIPRKGKFKVVAASGVAVVDRRSNSVRAIEKLTQAAVVLSRPLVVPTTDPLPPQIQQPLDHYLDESDVMSSVILPLHGKSQKENQDNDQENVIDVDPFGSEGEIVGVLVLEYFSGNSPSGIGPAMTTIASEATLALANSTEHRNVFGLKLWKTVGTAISKTKAPIAGAVGLIVAGLIAASAIIQVDHHVIATGKIEPTIRREVFASVDGTVKQLHVVDGQDVKKGDLLLTLENADLESQAESLAGEIQTATQRLASMSAVRLSENSMDNSGSRSSSSRLAMEERQLKSELANLRQQQEIVRTQMKTLSVSAPIDGTVIGWQLERRLLDRPVGRGNLLISVVDDNGPWSLKLNIPDDDAGPVIESNHVSGESEIEFAVATLPSSTFKAEMQSIATAARLDSRGQHVIDAEANVSIDVDSQKTGSDFDAFDPSMMRSGADVTAKIKCGRRSILRSWFGDVFDFVHRNVLFYF
ncbi:periplasmic multidrug efflux lipoprotein precursor [Rubripirellula obstinata]|uniref:Periplasmic multidrug efflux lipoprotein n=2 Tax=Rubripirellula obstinata TaxID=406547 RepID=A0A5B1CF32_9BACT|nr:periplasmic multidrug efflux lipoprotein precursor [Rubripirellula obstinata]